MIYEGNGNQRNNPAADGCAFPDHSVEIVVCGRWDPNADNIGRNGWKLSPENYKGKARLRLRRPIYKFTDDVKCASQVKLKKKKKGDKKI
jgi:hypothetical protein